MYFISGNSIASSSVAGGSGLVSGSTGGAGNTGGAGIGGSSSSSNNMTHHTLDQRKGYFKYSWLSEALTLFLKYTGCKDQIGRIIKIKKMHEIML